AGRGTVLPGVGRAPPPPALVGPAARPAPGRPVPAALGRHAAPLRRLHRPGHPLAPRRPRLRRPGRRVRQRDLHLDRGRPARRRALPPPRRPLRRHQRSGHHPNVAESVITQALRRNVVGAWGADGERWLADLPRVLAGIAEDWSLVVGPAYDLSYHYVAAVTCDDGTPAVLKLGVASGGSLAEEAPALRAFAGRGAVRLLRDD